MTGEGCPAQEMRVAEGGCTEKIAGSPAPLPPPLQTRYGMKPVSCPVNTVPSTLALANLTFTDNLTHWEVLLWEQIKLPVT